MKKIIFNCETITPMFLAGADGKTPEIRPPSIKGALRFWWRAINGHLPLEQLKRQEAEIFGGSGIDQGRCRFNIKTQLISEQIKNSLKESNIWDNKQNSIKREYEGWGYLFYSTIMQKNNQKPYFDKGTKFIVEILSNDKTILKEIANLFVLFSFFGAMGTRARRGAGNFFIENITDTDNLLNNNFVYRINTKDKNELAEFLENNILINKQFSNNNQTYSNFTSARIFILDSQNTPEECLEKLGKNYKAFRSRRNPDYDSIKTYLTNGDRPNTIEKAAMGLPINYKYRSLNGKSALIEGSHKERQRSASPIIFTIITAHNENNFIYFPTIIVFYRMLLEINDKIRIKDLDKNGLMRPVSTQKPSNQILDDFINQLPNAVEITL